MPQPLKLALLSLFCLGVGAFAQKKPIPDASEKAARSTAARVVQRASSQEEMMGADDATALINVALKTRRSDAKMDCSHLVHTIYSRAGFPYSYVKSSDLYAGSEPFRRVSRAQAGDLVVWRGHVGIVINPAQHSFFSKLRSGLGVDFYDAPYWKTRGPQRFFRYEKADSPRPATVAQKGDPVPARRDTPQLVDASARTNRPPLRVDNYEIKLDSRREQREIQRALVVNAKRPSSEQLLTAILSNFAENGDSLRSVNVFELSQPLTVVDEIEIQKIHVSGDTGWADVRINASSSILQGRPDFKKRSEHQRWSMLRIAPESWEVALPAETIYVARDEAAQLFAQQLAALTQDSQNSSAAAGQKAELARLLNALLVR